MLRDRVLNYLQREPDSKEGMACQICELCIRLEVLPTMGAPAAMLIGDAYRLGRLVILAKAYGIDGEQSRVAAKAPRPGRRDPLRTKIIEAMRPLRRNDLTLLAALKAMQTAAHNGLTVSFLADADRYEVIDEDDLNDSAGTYGIDALERMWTAAKK